MATSFGRLQEQSQRLTKLLMDFSGFDESLVMNILIYAKCLPRPEAPNEIDELVFTSQMLKVFNFTSPVMVSLMFGAVKNQKLGYVSIEEYCKLICIFLTENLDQKTNFVFKVYDLNQDGEINFQELYYFLRPCVILTESEDMEAEEATRELIEIVLKVTDIDESGSIDLQEFKRLIKNNVLYLQLLGPCLPIPSSVQRFRERLEGKGTHEIRTMFKHERQESLQELPSINRVKQYYTVTLDLP
ncbi:unnamed protein product [Lymnaea stagnalis]|uniref:EF-hand domain-containing protein n=1 Tax=Lymnaea stagnalis TaxID=6523 RepID=A0AAV2HX58_LYMST